MRPSGSIRWLFSAAAVAAVAALLISWTRSAQAALPQGSITVGTQTVATGLVSPIGLTNAGDSRLFVVDQVGKIRIVENGNLLPTPFLDLSSKIVPLGANYDERGLLGLAFHPDYSSNGKFYVNYSAPGAPTGWNHRTVVAEFKVSANPNIADSLSERVVLTYNQPQGNHNGGQLAFSPADGYLYIASGDGGGANDSGANHTAVTGNGQDKTKPLGKILRIDVDGRDSGKEYAVPSTNPFVQDPNALPEIFAYGLRNPYSFSFDRGGDHKLIAADVGQNLVEEVNIIVSGGNYGWKAKEGTNAFDPALPQTGYIDPIAQYMHPDGSAVVGGYVYRGSGIPALQGMYVFGDLSANLNFQNPVGQAALFYLDPEASPLVQIWEMGVGSPHTGLGQVFLKGFGQDSSGELYALVSTALGPSGSGGMVVKIVPEPSSLAALLALGGPWAVLLRRRQRGLDG